MKIYIGADHGGWKMKSELVRWLQSIGHEVADVGNIAEDVNDDYVDYAVKVVQGMRGDPQSRGIVLCRNGFGMAIVCNRFSNVRCGVAFDRGAVVRGRNDDDINCLSIPADYVLIDEVKRMVEAFLGSEFAGEERYERRLKKIEEMQKW